MFKVERLMCLQDLAIEADGKTGTFTDGKIYYARRSKKGNIVIKSNEGQWTVFNAPTLSYTFSYGGKFRPLRAYFFNNLKDFKQMSL